MRLINWPSIASENLLTLSTIPLTLPIMLPTWLLMLSIILLNSSIGMVTSYVPVVFPTFTCTSSGLIFTLPIVTSAFAPRLDKSKITVLLSLPSVPVILSLPIIVTPTSGFGTHTLPLILMLSTSGIPSRVTFVLIFPICSIGVQVNL